MATPSRLDLLLEAERRGLTLPPEDRALVDEARQRGFIPSVVGEVSRAQEIMGIVREGGFSEETFRRAQAATGKEIPGTSILPLLLSTAGATAGRRAGVIGQAIGAGAGAAVGEAANPPVFRAIGAGELPTPSFFDLARTFGLTGLFDLAGQGVIGAARRIPGIRAKPEAPEIIKAFEETGVSPKITDISASRLPAAAERGVAQTMTGGAIISEKAEQQAGQILRARDEFLGRLQQRAAGSDVAAGESVTQAIERQATRVKDVENHLWTELRGAATDLPVPLTKLKEAAQEIRLQQERLLPAQRNTKLLKLTKDIDEAPPTLLWQRVDEMRREFGAGVQKGELLSGVSPMQSERLYSAALTDMERAAMTSDVPGLGQVYRQVRQFGAQARALFKDSEIARVMEADPENVVKMLAGGPSVIARAKEAILGSGRLGLAMPTAEARESWDLFRRHVLESVFERATDKSAKGFVTEPLSGIRLERLLKDLGDDSLKELLTGTERKALDNILVVAKAVRLGERAGAASYTSATGQALSVQALMAAPGAVVGGAVAGPPGAAVGSVMSLLFLPVPVAKILTSEPAARFVASPRFGAAVRGTEVAGRITGELVRATARLGGILVAEDQARR